MVGIEPPFLDSIERKINTFSLIELNPNYMNYHTKWTQNGHNKNLNRSESKSSLSKTNGDGGNRTHVQNGSK